MVLSRRTVLAGAATGAVASTAGCLGFVLGDGLEFVAAAATPSEEALVESGYTELEARSEEQVETIDVVVERDVTIGYWIAGYGMEEPADIDLGFGSLFVTATPDATVLGRSMNPIADMDSRELMGAAARQSDTETNLDPSEPEHVETRTMSILGDDRDVDVFHSTREMEGQQIQFELLVSSFDHEEDILVLFGAYPLEYDRDREAVQTLMESIEHPVDR